MAKGRQIKNMRQTHPLTLITDPTTPRRPASHVVSFTGGSSRPSFWAINDCALKRDPALWALIRAILERNVDRVKQAVQAAHAQSPEETKDPRVLTLMQAFKGTLPNYPIRFALMRLNQTPATSDTELQHLMYLIEHRERVYEMTAGHENDESLLKFACTLDPSLGSLVNMVLQGGVDSPSQNTL